MDYIECIYVINKKAKEFEEKSSTDKIQNKIDKIRKEALYQLKYKCLKSIEEKAQEKEIHIINGQKYLYLNFNKHSFHAPIEYFETHEQKLNTKKLSNFNISRQNEKRLSLKKALQFLNKEKGYNANDYLSQKYIHKNNNKHFTGWSYLF